MSTLYQNCADAIDDLDNHHGSFDSVQQQITLQAGEGKCGSIDAEQAKLKVIRTLQNTFIDNGNVIRVNELLKFCGQNDYRLASYRQPETRMPGLARFVLEVPGYQIVVQAK